MTTTATTELDLLLAPALAAYSAELDAHAHVYGELGARSCRCGFVGKGRAPGRSVGLHISAAEKRASRAYDATTAPLLAAYSAATPAERTAMVEAAAPVEAPVEELPVEAGDEPVRYHRAVDPAPGVREYLVTRGAVELGTVTNRRGGWWRAVTPAGDYAGSFHKTRIGAADALIRRHDTATAATAAGVELDEAPAPAEDNVVVTATPAEVERVYERVTERRLAIDTGNPALPAATMPDRLVIRGAVEATGIAQLIATGRVRLFRDGDAPWVEVNDDYVAPAPLTLVPATRSELPADLYSAAVRTIARAHVAAGKLPTLAGVPFPETKAAACRIAGMVDLLVELTGTDHDDVVEDVDDAYLALVEH